METQAIIREMEALRALLNDVVASRRQAQLNIAELRRSEMVDWQRYDALTADLARRQIQEDMIQNRINVLQAALNRGRLFGVFPNRRQGVLDVPEADPMLAGMMPYGYGPIVQNVNVPARRYDDSWAVLGAVLLLLGLAILASLWWWKYNPPSSGEGPGVIRTVPAPTTVAEPQQAAPAIARAECATTAGNFEIWGRMVSGFKVEPCPSGMWLPPNAAVYADSDLSSFGIPLYKSGPGARLRDRFVGYTTDTIKLESNVGFFYVPNVTMQVAEDWRFLLQGMGFGVDEVVELRQRR